MRLLCGCSAKAGRDQAAQAGRDGAGADHNSRPKDPVSCKIPRSFFVIPSAPRSESPVASSRISPPPPDVGARVLAEVLRRGPLAPDSVSSAVFGHVAQAGTGMNPARQATLNGGLPESVPARTVNRGRAGTCRQGDREDPRHGAAVAAHRCRRDRALRAVFSPRRVPGSSPARHGPSMAACGRAGLPTILIRTLTGINGLRHDLAHDAGQG